MVGGGVRDEVLGIVPKDLDVEVFGLTADELAHVLGQFGPVNRYGASFPVLGVGNLGIDFALPRAADFAEAASHRDLTINSMGRDLSTHALLDPHGGMADLQAKRLRATDAKHFGADPLRGMRVAQLAARLRMQPDAALLRLCGEQDLSGLPGERLFEEFRKLLMLADQPSIGLQVLHASGLLRFFPDLAAMVGVPQDARWHPEGDVWAHTLMVVDEAAALRDGGAMDLTLMLAALLHDVGKPATTQVGAGGVVRARGHDVMGTQPAGAFLTRLRAPKAIIEAVQVLVRHHLAPALLPAGDAKNKAYRRLMREVHAAGVDGQTLVRLARADQWGRTTADALARSFVAGDLFWAKIQGLDITAATVDVVQGRHLIALGHVPGPSFRELLGVCRDLQDETGCSDAHEIITLARNCGAQI